MTETIPTLETVTDAVEFMTALRRDHDDVGVFVDGDPSSPRPDITVIVDGQGNDPHARIAPDVYRELVDDELVGEDTCGGYKHRRFHDFVATVIVGGAR